MRGVITKIFHDGKGFGFLKGSDGASRMFHASRSPQFDALRKDDDVEFTDLPDDPQRGGNGKRAEKVAKAC